DAEVAGGPCPLPPHAGHPFGFASGDDPVCEMRIAWPVLLGRLVRDDATDLVYAVEHACRRYAGLVGAEIASASTVAVPEDPAHPPLVKPEPVRSATVDFTERVDGQRRVAVRVSDDTGMRTERIRIDTLRGVSIRART